jgi:hypothetical protein
LLNIFDEVLFSYIYMLLLALRSTLIEALLESVLSRLDISKDLSDLVYSKALSNALEGDVGTTNS